MITENIILGNNVDITPGVSINNIKTGNNGKIRNNTIIFGGHNTPFVIGNDFFIGVNCYINGVAGITIGDRVTIAHGSMLFSDSGPNTSELLQKDFPIVSKPIVIGNDVWIGAGVKIMPGVTIGDHCVIGANSVVTKNVPSNSVYAGTPAKLLRSL